MKRSNKILLIGAAAASVVLGGLLYFLPPSKLGSGQSATTTSQTSSIEPETAKPQTKPEEGEQKEGEEEQRIRKAILSYLCKPDFISPDFLEQVTGVDANLQVYNLDEEMLYFDIRPNAYSKDCLARLSRKPDSIEFGTAEDGKFLGNRLKLGEYFLRKPGHYFLRFPAKNFKVNPSGAIAIQFRKARYTALMTELADFLSNKSIYGGPKWAIKGIDRYGVRTLFANHGALVAKKGEPSLERLVKQLVPKGSSNEITAQRLLDFVTSEIRYDQEDADNPRETLKRPNEVLMTGKSVCTGKSVLYASLLEQTGVPYRIFYLDSHVTVAVQGNFGNYNGLSFRLGDCVYSIAEASVKEGGFVIGETTQTTLDLAINASGIEYTQVPGPDSKIINARTGKPVKFKTD